MEYVNILWVLYAHIAGSVTCAGRCPSSGALQSYRITVSLKIRDELVHDALAGNKNMVMEERLCN